MRYQLRLICTLSLELYRTEFRHPQLTSEQRCTRGKNDEPRGIPQNTPHSISNRESGSFQYSRAVRALTLLVAEQLLAGSRRSVQLSGVRGSLASSLDQAVAREPQWLIDMFGVGPQGEPLCRKLFVRSNPNHKKPGPVSIGFRQALLEELSLQLSINGLREATQDELQTICDVIRAEEDSALAGTGFFDSLATVLDSWLLSSLRNFEIFSASGAVARLKAINADPVFSRFAAKPLLLEHLNSPPSYDWVHGLLNAEELAELQAMPQLRIATPLSVIGSQLIIQHTAESLNLPLICDSSFPHAAGLAEDIVSGRFSESFDGMALSAPPATRVLGKREFIPITYLPEVTHHLLGTSGEIDAGEYLIFTYGGPTTPLFLFRHLQQKRVLARQGTTMTSAEPHEVLQRFSTAPDKSRSLLFAPYSLVIASTLKLAHREIGSGSPADSACFLFIRSGRLSKRLRYLLEKALRHAWLELLERPQLRRNLLRQSFSEDNVARSFHRVCGLPFAA